MGAVCFTDCSPTQTHTIHHTVHKESEKSISLAVSWGKRKRDVMTKTNSRWDKGQSVSIRATHGEKPDVSIWSSAFKGCLGLQTEVCASEMILTSC